MLFWGVWCSVCKFNSSKPMDTTVVMSVSHVGTGAVLARKSKLHKTPASKLPHTPQRTPPETRHSADMRCGFNSDNWIHMCSTLDNYNWFIPWGFRGMGVLPAMLCGRMSPTTACSRSRPQTCTPRHLSAGCCFRLLRQRRGRGSGEGEASEMWALQTNDHLCTRLRMLHFISGKWAFRNQHPHQIDLRLRNITWTSHATCQAPKLTCDDFAVNPLLSLLCFWPSTAAHADRWCLCININGYKDIDRYIPLIYCYV